MWIAFCHKRAMSGELFKVSKLVKFIEPDSLQHAIVVAEKIIRSDVFRDCVLDLFVGHPRKTRLEYINRQDLMNLLNNSTITIDLSRQIDFLGSRAAVNPTYNPSVIYVNPVMLLEMKIREIELEECKAEKYSSADLTFDFDEAELCDRHGKLYSREFNSLVFVEQMMSKDQQLGSSSDTTDFNMSTVKNHLCSGNNQSSSFNLVTKHVLLLTTVIIHETSHLINHALSKVLVPTDSEGYITPTQFCKHNTKKNIKFKNYGHMIEKELFGFVIQHSCNKHFKAPFAVEQIIGSEFEGMNDFKVLVPTPDFLGLLSAKTVDEIDTFQIDSALLRLVPTEEFKGQTLDCANNRGSKRKCTFGALLKDSVSTESIAPTSEAASTSAVSDSYEPPLALVAKSDGKVTVASLLANRFIRS